MLQCVSRVHEETGDNLVAIHGVGSPVIGVRTVGRRPADERWSRDTVVANSAEPRCPNPKIPDSSSVLTHAQSRNMRADEDPEGGSSDGKEFQGDDEHAAPVAGYPDQRDYPESGAGIAEARAQPQAEAHWSIRDLPF